MVLVVISLAFVTKQVRFELEFPLGKESPSFLSGLLVKQSQPGQGLSLALLQHRLGSMDPLCLHGTAGRCGSQAAFRKEQHLLFAMLGLHQDQRHEGWNQEGPCTTHSLHRWGNCVTASSKAPSVVPPALNLKTAAGTQGSCCPGQLSLSLHASGITERS